ncbi:hypothetical protein GS397_15085 [Sphingobium yanoikuyae]|uniref:Uncharacterized protein n=1 Tax=Sphingobium yanoikuyae TaxID=13690 RepID=A0A6P1GI72_SPHYA|nr:hypothetical protein [Sphingobium yanoikuyae]QHD68237.1 hypothetical protein GS397_15085 [Sphingobium yanoikuyae]
MNEAVTPALHFRKGLAVIQHRGRPKLSLIDRTGNKGKHERAILTDQPIANAGQDREAHITAAEAVKELMPGRHLATVLIDQQINTISDRPPS